MSIDAILWDYDGTMVNSVPKNIDTTKQILAEVAPRLTGDNLPLALQSEEEYHLANHRSKNWQDLYINYYGMTEEEMQKAGPLWTEFQLKNTTPVELFPDIKRIVSEIKSPQGICSQNSAENIHKLLQDNKLSDKIDTIIGYENVPHNKQKPDACGGIRCIEEIHGTSKNKTIMYIGDHEGDVEFARNIEKELCDNSKVISVAVIYSGADTKNWKHQADYEITQPSELLKIINQF